MSGRYWRSGRKACGFPACPLPCATRRAPCGILPALLPLAFPGVAGPAWSSGSEIWSLPALSAADQFVSLDQLRCESVGTLNVGVDWRDQFTKPAFRLFPRAIRSQPHQPKGLVQRVCLLLTGVVFWTVVGELTPEPGKIAISPE